ncbi:MAG: PIN domain-containing protein [marine benthic group bacterium]|nr:PIN domain-containing protein [Candidatus Benthicola marisminoris]
MMLVDTSVWVDHLRRGNRDLTSRLEADLVWCHPFVVGELACGRLSDRERVLELLEALPCSPVADHAEVLTFIDRWDLAGSGIGWVDAHLLASAMLGRIGIWTLDRNLDDVARRLGIRF